MQVRRKGPMRSGRGKQAQTESSKSRVNGGTVHGVTVNAVSLKPRLTPPRALSVVEECAAERVDKIAGSELKERSRPLSLWFKE